MPPRHPETLVAPPEQIVVSTKRVACDGGGVLGHPLVYLDMGGETFVECGYCDRRFVLSADHHAESDYLDPAARPPEAH
ncbi:zinc-finger domain-containing protein [Brevundimonas subvibrioides]|uniref:Zinc finger, CHCC-type n=1 Tax=Brevundimonas subvibrioides (strain ATCC 15264 / DSM 4735 / LMG 14903 / NBRC 16000 / CB 81) TaxID=633149 RepID=D9QJ34_BRESC|nr:zinc-finger domain-containing protein [Brevundimonas subvibrioides]ADK99558.1 Zinc finger, CHCC-type [Brevundimonas subvibrioides ATCC 15264]